MTTLRKNSPKRKQLMARCKILRQDLIYHITLNGGSTETTQEKDIQNVCLKALADINSILETL